MVDGATLRPTSSGGPGRLFFISAGDPVDPRMSLQASGYGRHGAVYHRQGRTLGHLHDGTTGGFCQWVRLLLLDPTTAARVDDTYAAGPPD